MNQENATSYCTANPVHNTLMSCLPEELRKVMKPITKHTDNVAGGEGNKAQNVTSTVDYLPLLSVGEVGLTGGANSYEIPKTSQYDYYLDSDNLIRHRQVSGQYSTSRWWLRSPSSTTSTYFNMIGETGVRSSVSSATSLMLSPIFLI